MVPSNQASSFSHATLVCLPICPALPPLPTPSTLDLQEVQLISFFCYLAVIGKVLKNRKCLRQENTET